MDVKMLAAVVFAMFLTAALDVHAADPELLTDFIMPDGVKIDADFFTSYALKDKKANESSPFATVTRANLKSPGNFTVLEGLGVSTSLVQFPPGTINRPHTHPRGSEIVFAIDGCLDVFLLDSTNKLLTQTLCQGELFAVPRNLVHFQFNRGEDGKSATAYVSFSSANPGTIVLPTTFFGSNKPIDLDILAKSFQVSPEIIKSLQAAQ